MAEQHLQQPQNWRNVTGGGIAPRPNGGSMESVVIPEAFNSERWAAQFTLHMAGEFKKDKYAEHNTTGRTKAWIDGWQRAWTEAFIVLCSVIEEQYTHPDSMLLRWVGIEVAASWPQESVVLRRWKSRETNQWKYAVCELRSEWGYGAESQFLLIERSCNAEA